MSARRRRFITFQVYQEIKPPMRYKFGPSQSHSIQGDLEISLDSITIVDGIETVNVTVPPHDPATQARPSRVFAVYAPAAPGPEASPEEFLGASGHLTGVAEVDGDPTTPNALAIAVPGVSPGVYFVQTVLEFAS